MLLVTENLMLIFSSQEILITIHTHIPFNLNNEKVIRTINQF